jgi:hypothetical protein
VAIHSASGCPTTGAQASTWPRTTQAAARAGQQPDASLGGVSHRDDGKLGHIAGLALHFGALRCGAGAR